MSVDPSKPLLFAAMPFGERAEPGGSRVVDFDLVFETCIRPAAADAGVELIRADEELVGGIIHGPMFERLLLAEVVIADLTFANPNVFYELGVRHAARPHATILIYANIAQLPFDVGLIRAIPYELDPAGTLLSPDKLRLALAERIEHASTGPAVDSPLFDLVEGYPGITLAHESTKTFRERAVWISELTLRANELARSDADRQSVRSGLAAVEAEAAGLKGAEEQLLVMIMLAYRAISEWGEVIRVADSLSDRSRSSPAVRELLAMALSRRNQGHDRTRAIEIIRGVIAEHGDSSESLGILGRCYKARWQEKLERGDPGADDALDLAVEAYRQGFESDPRDFYPGVNLVTLLVTRGLEDDLAEVGEVAPVVSFAASRMGGVRSQDYWVVATALEMAALTGNHSVGARALSALDDVEADSWMYETTADNLEIVLGALPSLGHPCDWVKDARAALLRRATSPE